jgi:hypothetical protein
MRDCTVDIADATKGFEQFFRVFTAAKDYIASNQVHVNASIWTDLYHDSMQENRRLRRKHSTENLSENSIVLGTTSEPRIGFLERF